MNYFVNIFTGRIAVAIVNEFIGTVDAVDSGDHTAAFVRLGNLSRDGTTGKVSWNHGYFVGWRRDFRSADGWQPRHHEWRIVFVPEQNTKIKTKSNTQHLFWNSSSTRLFLTNSDWACEPSKLPRSGRVRRLRNISTDTESKRRPADVALNKTERRWWMWGG